jgi:HSF-type DNA-binding
VPNVTSALTSRFGGRPASASSCSQKKHVPVFLSLVAFAPFVFAFLKPQVIPLYFDHKRLGSVKRQMGFYGFKRISKGRIEMEYQHEFFRKNQPHLLSHIKRATKSKGKATTAAAAAAAAGKTSIIHEEAEASENDDEDDTQMPPPPYPANITSSSESAGQEDERLSTI